VTLAAFMQYITIGQLELSQTAQHWFNVVLIWIGFGTLAGLLAKTLMPAREPSSAIAIVAIGILGSVIGPLALSYLLRQETLNPLGPLSLVASAAGALLLMVLYRLVVIPLVRRGELDD
jgi:uncharacterized membrane protein YeaQ/YmgE (transglycosylase-associated protein family)